MLILEIPRTITLTLRLNANMLKNRWHIIRGQRIVAFLATDKMGTTEPCILCWLPVFATNSCNPLSPTFWICGEATESQRRALARSVRTAHRAATLDHIHALISLQTSPFTLIQTTCQYVAHFILLRPQNLENSNLQSTYTCAFCHSKWRP